jgi:hypothetical protein
MGVALPAPDFSTLSRRAIGLSVVDDRPQSSGPITLNVDSTGLKIHRGSGWLEEKHGTRKTRKSWRKLHIGYDPDSGEIMPVTDRPIPAAPLSTAIRRVPREISNPAQADRSHRRAAP